MDNAATFIVPATERMSTSTTLLWITLVSIAGFALRYALLDQSNLDIVTYSMPWLSQLRDAGFWNGIGKPFEGVGYPPIYTYLMGLADSLLPVGTDGKSVMKSIPILFDYLAAGLLFAIATIRWGAGWERVAAYASMMFAPTIILNGAYWGQSDIVYSSFIVACILFLIRKSDLLAMIFFGLAFSIKLQSMWFAPFILMMLLRGRIRWRLLLIPPLVYFMATIPTLLAGRSAFEVMTVYLTQVESQSVLNYSAANVQLFIGYVLRKTDLSDELTQVIAKLSILFTVVLSLHYALKFSRGRLTDTSLIMAAVTSVLLAPQFLPHMHERYFFLADVLTIVLLVWAPIYWPAAVLMQFNSFVSYIAFLWGKSLLAYEVPLYFVRFGFTNNLQLVTGLVASAGIINLGLLIWFWRRLQSRLSKVATRPGAIDSSRPAAVPGPSFRWHRPP